MELEYITRLGAVHIDGPSQNMPARSSIFYLFGNGPQRLGNLSGRQSHSLETLRIARNGFNHHGIPGMNCQYRLRRSRIITDNDRLRASRQMMSLTKRGRT